jgi:hypothetical protein
MKLTDKALVPAEVIFRQVGNETVLLDLSSGTYFGLDPVGTRMWQLIETGSSLAEVVDQIAEQYEISRDVLEQDALAFARDLIQKKLISVVVK